MSSAPTSQFERNPSVHTAAIKLPLRSSSSFTIFACALFAVLGIVTTLLGPTLPLLSSRWGISQAQAGALFFYQFISSTIGTLLAGTILAKRSFKAATVLGVVLCLLGVAALVVVNWNWGRYAGACYGFGLGTALPAMNLAVAEANRTRRAASVSILNFAWGIGAISGPVLLRATHSLDVFLLLVSAFLFAGLIGSMLTAVPGRTPPSSNQITPADRSRSLWTLVPLFAFSMFLFCGIENAVAGWAASLALPSFSNLYTALNANIAFWTFFLAGRALAPMALRFLTEAKLLVISIVSAALGVLAFYFAVHPAAILGACAVAGLGIGPGFPLLIARVSELIGSQHPASTVCFAFAGVGAATLPTLSGLLGAKFGNPRAELLLPLAGLLFLLPITRKSQQASSGISASRENQNTTRISQM